MGGGGGHALRDCMVTPDEEGQVQVLREREGERERERGYIFFVFLREIHVPYYILIASLFTQEFVLSASKLAS